MKLSAVLPSVASLIAAEPTLSAIPLITAADPEHNTKLQRAINETTGLCIVATLSAGRLKDAKTPLVHITC